MPDNRGKYSIEELIRAKRDEKPDEAFWSRFDRELKDKQRRLLQRQIGERVDLRSPFAKRIYKFTAVGSSLGFAAIAVTIGFRTHSNDHAASSVPQQETESVAQQTEAASLAPVFTVSQPAVKRVEPTAPALQEFSTLSQAPRPRIVVEVLNPDISNKTRNLAAAEPAPRPAARATARSARVGEFSAEFTASLGLIQDAATIDDELNEPLSQRLSSLEQNYYLGKYANPLGGDFSAAFDTAARSSPKDLQQREARSFSDLDERLSSQGNRSSKSLDSLTLRF